MHRIVLQVYAAHGHDFETMNLMCDIERALDGQQPLEGNLVGRYAMLMKRLDEK